MKDIFNNPHNFTYLLKPEEIAIGGTYSIEVEYVANPATGHLTLTKISFLPALAIIVKDWKETNQNIKSAAYADIQKQLKVA